MIRVVLVCASVVLSGCREGGVKTVEPELGLGAPIVDFGVVKVGESRTLKLALEARTQAAVEVQSATVNGATFTLGDATASIPALGRTDLEVTFTPRAPGTDTATLELASNDVRTPRQTVELRGLGAVSEVRVSLGCDAGAGCVSRLNAAPLAIDFGEEPLVRRLPLEEGQLPFVEVRNVGLVPALLEATLAGSDRVAFTLLGPSRATLEPDAGLRLPLRFVPPTQASTSFTASLELRSDAPANPVTSIGLTGRARPNLPPTVCLNLTEVQLGAEPASTWTAERDWLLTPPDGGYDFTTSRPIAPGAVVTLSAHAPQPRACTVDPEDGRLLLTYEWSIESSPGPPPALAGATSPVLRLIPVATGDTVVKLVVRDAQGNASETRATFRVEVRNDLVVQLAWSAPDGGATGVDLDLLLVRPGGRPFGLVLRPDGGAVSDTASGFVTQNALRTLGVTPDWGFPGAPDDPRLNVDDSGDGPLVENVSLNSPANACLPGSCRFGVFVHAFRDARPVGARACQVSQCRDGAVCDCPAPLRCVADVAPLDAGVAGAGRCQTPVEVEVKVFSSSRAVGTLPLALTPPDTLTLASPCQLLHVADVEWPPTGSDAGVRLLPVGVDAQGRFTSPAITRFGWRPASATPSRDCAPNVRQAIGAASTPWFSEEPR